MGIDLHSSQQRALSPYKCHLFPPQQKEAFKKRWFTLDHRRLMYFKDPLVRGRSDLWQLQATVLRAGSKCNQSLASLFCSVIREAGGFPKVPEWTLGLPLSIPLHSSHTSFVSLPANNGNKKGKGVKAVGARRVTW